MAKESVKEITEQFFEGNYIKLLHFVEKECDALLVK